MDVWQGALVRLRAPEPGDAPLMQAHQRDGEVERMGDEIHYPQSVAAIAARMAAERTGDDVSLVIEGPDGRVIGGLSIFCSSPRHGVAWIGLGIAERGEWGKGYGPDAVRIAIRHLFRERRYNKVQALVYSINERSLRMFRRLGFQEEGRLRQGHFTDGAYCDEVIFGMTRAEFEAMM